VRTTLTLDDDVAAKLQAEVRRTGQPFKRIVNHFLRAGLNTRRQARPLRPFAVEAQPLGLRWGLTYDNISEMLDQLEGPARH
jgi:hypothetical protein